FRSKGPQVYTAISFFNNFNKNMSRYKVSIASIEPVTHDVMRIRTERPKGLDFTPGQATEIFLDKAGWENEGRPFTFTSLPDNDRSEFTIKCYKELYGVRI